jgi:hypothetical protein
MAQRTPLRADIGGRRPRRGCPHTNGGCCDHRANPRTLTEHRPEPDERVDRSGVATRRIDAALRPNAQRFGAPFRRSLGRPMPAPQAISDPKP